jgi:phosphate-selective porin
LPHRDTTLAVNWHLNPDLRVTANWVHAYEDDSSGKSNADIFATRVGFEF